MPALARLWHRLPGHAETLLAALLFLSGPVIYLAPLAAAWLMPVIMLAGLAVAREEGRLAVASDLAAGWHWAPLVVFMAVSATWALDAQAALILALRLAGLLLSALLLARTLYRLPPMVLERALTALAWGFALAGLVILADLASAGRLLAPLHRLPDGRALANLYGRGGAIQAALAVPLALALWRSGDRRFALLQLLIAGLAVGVGSNLSAKLAILIALLAAATVLAVPRLRWLLVAGILLGAGSLPWLLPYHPDEATFCRLAADKPSALHRILIANFVDQNIRLKPITGWGLDASRRLPGGHDRLHVESCPEDGKETGVAIDGEILPLHPHNAVLQVWLELGGVGALLGFGALAFTLGAAFRAPDLAHRVSRAALAAGAAAGVSVALISFGIWQEWWIASLGLLAAALAGAARLAAAPPWREQD